MEVICLESTAFYKLIDEVVARIKDKQHVTEWIDADEAMKRLNIKKTSLQNFRDEGKIRFTYSGPKTILYDASSISEYLNKKAENTFQL